MRDPFGDSRELQRALKSMREFQRALEPMREIQRTLKSMSHFRDAIDSMHTRSPLAKMREVLPQLQVRNPLAEHMQAWEALRLRDPLADTRKLLESGRFVDPFQHTRELLRALSTSADLYRSVHGESISSAAIAAAVANIEANAEIEVGTAEQENLLRVVSRTIQNVRTATYTSFVDRLSLEFYLSLLVTVLLLIYQLELSKESEQRITSEIISTREQLLERYEEVVTQQANHNTYYVVRRATVLLQSPKKGARSPGVLYPNQLTRLVDRRGKWIRVEYFDYLSGVHRSGWCLKKYLDRMPPGSLDSQGHPRL